MARPVRRVGRVTATVVVTDRARKTATAAVAIDVRRLRVQVVRAYRRKGRLVVRVRTTGPGVLRVQAGVGRAARIVRGVKVTRARLIDVRMPKGAKVLGKVRLRLALVRPQGARAAANVRVRIAPRPPR